MKNCLIPSCDGTYLACGYCKLHYQRLYRKDKEKLTRVIQLKRGPRSKNPLHSHPLYKIWRAMQDRCENDKQWAYKYYGARGIKVSDHWKGKGGFQRFLSDMGERPTPDHQIDRINNEGNYEPGNCRWATRKEQAANRRPYNSCK